MNEFNLTYFRCVFISDIFHAAYQTPGWTATRSMILSCLRSAGFGSSHAVEDKVLEQVQIMTGHLDKLVGSGQPVDLGEELFPKATFGVFFQVIMNLKYDYDDPELSELMRITNESLICFMDAFALETLPEALIYTVYASKVKDILAKMKKIRDFIGNEITKHKATLDPENPRDFIDLYLTKADGKHELSRMIDNVYMVLPDATSTICIGISLVFARVVYHQKVQKQVYDEIVALTGGNREVTWADKVKLPYTEAVIMEVLRINPLFAMTGEHAVPTEITFRGYRIPKRAHILANISAIHRDPALFPDPEEFRPERFLNNQGKLVKPDTWMPFGKGECILYLYLSRFSFLQIDFVLCILEILNDCLDDFIVTNCIPTLYPTSNSNREFLNKTVICQISFRI